MALLILSWALTGCLFDSGVLWEDEQYHVAWIDTGDSTTLYYTIENGGVGKIKPEIIAVGSNEFYVVARRKSSPDNGYYYIKKSKIHPYPGGGDSTHGPYTAAQFAKLKKDLNLPDFEKTFK